MSMYATGQQYLKRFWSHGNVSLLRLRCGSCIRRIVFIKHLFCKLKVFVLVCNLQAAHLHVPLFMELYMKLPKHFVSMLIGMWHSQKCKLLLRAICIACRVLCTYLFCSLIGSICQHSSSIYSRHYQVLVYKALLAPFGGSSVYDLWSCRHYLKL